MYDLGVNELDQYEISIDRSAANMCKIISMKTDELTGSVEEISMRVESWEAYLTISRWTAEGDINDGVPLLTPEEIHLEILPDVQAGIDLSTALEKWIENWCYLNEVKYYGYGTPANA